MRDDVSVQVRLPREMHARAVERAAWEGCPSLGVFVRDAVRVYLCDHAQAFEGVCGDCGRVEVQ